MVSHPGVLESEGHGGVAIRTEEHDERCLDLVFFLEGDLVIVGVIVKEGEQFTAGESTTLSIRGRPKGSLGQCLLRSV